MPDIDLTGIGEHRPDHRRGYLVFAALPGPIQDAEDSTAFADYQDRRSFGHIHQFRPASTTEKALLRHLDHEVPETLETRVQWLSDGIRNRSWPALRITPEGTTAP